MLFLYFFKLMLNLYGKINDLIKLGLLPNMIKLNFTIQTLNKNYEIWSNIRRYYIVFSPFPLLIFLLEKKKSESPPNCLVSFEIHTTVDNMKLFM